MLDNGKITQQDFDLCAMVWQFFALAHSAITVKSANILTCNLIIFGQGIMRCHSALLHDAVTKLITVDAFDPDYFKGKSHE